MGAISQLVLRVPTWCRWGFFASVIGSWVCAFGVASSSIGVAFEQRLSDWIWAQFAQIEPESRFVFVDIDERSLATTGAWPWPRQTFARLIQELQAAGASQITIDGLFPDSREGDQELARVFANTPQPKAAITFALPGNEQVRSGVLPVSFGSQLCDANLFPNAVGFLGNSPSLRVGGGHISPRVDRDGVIRATPAFICFEGQAYPSLALDAFLSALDIPASAVEVERGDGLTGSLSLELDPGMRIPLSPNGDLVIPFYSRSDSFNRISATDVLNGKATLDGQWVVIGSSAVGLSDRVATPLAPLEAGALVHLRLLSGLLDERLPRTVPLVGSAFWFAAILLAIGLGILAITQRLRWWMVPLGVVSYAIVSNLLSGWLRFNMHWLVELIGPNSMVLFAGVASTAVAFVQYRVERAELIGRLGAYLPLEVATRVADGQSVGSVDMSRRQAVLMTVDLRNFDRWAERLESQLSAAVLHHYVCSVSDRIKQHGGVVLQVSGCRIRATWPLSYDASQIVNLTKRLIAEVDNSFPDIETDSELPPMGLGIGIEQGDVLMGTYGSETSRGFSLLGDVALMVQGLVRMTVDLSTPCLMGPEFASRVSAPDKGSLGVFLLEETTSPRELFEIPTENLH